MFLLTLFIYLIMAFSPDVFPFSELDDQEFNLLIFEMQNGSIKYNADRLDCLHFNPFLQGDNYLTLSSDLDPDLNMFNHTNDCNYYVEEQFNDFFNSKVKSSHVFQSCM